MPKVSAGILMYHRIDSELRVLLAHPGGPFFARKDDGAWTIPKGEAAEGEDLLETAKREFQEELGTACTGPFIPLGEVKQAGGKIVHAWAAEGTVDASTIQSNTFEIEWPPRSGKKQSFPEVDRAAFFSLTEAQQKINPAQAAFLTALEKHVAA